MNEEINELKKSELKISKGYRLKVSTHSMIKGLQEITGNDSDTVITESCLMLFAKVIKEKGKNLKNKEIRK